MTYGCSFYTVSTIRSLGRRGIEVIAGDRYPLTPSRLSPYTTDTFCYPDPEYDAERFLAALEQAVRDLAPVTAAPYVLLPMHRESLLIALHQHRFAPHIRVLLPDRRALELIQDPERMVRHAHAQGVPVVPAGTADGGEYAICYVSALFSRGRLRASVAYRHDAPGRGSLLGTGECVHAPYLDQWMRALFGSLGWHGLAHAMFRWDQGSGPGVGLLQANPYFFQGLFDVIAAGVDYPWLLYLLTADSDTLLRPDQLCVRAETPVLCLLGMIGEIAESESALERLETRWRGAGIVLCRTSAWQACQGLLQRLRGSFDATVRLNRVQKLLRENQAIFKAILDDEDPFPALAILYQLARFVRHGRLEPAFPGG